jgi:hypothetical protein
MTLDFSFYDPKKRGNEGYPNSSNVEVEWASLVLYI